MTTKKFKYFPKFIREGRVFKNLNPDENENFEVKFYAKNDNISNFEEFENLVEICNYFQSDLTPSIFIYRV